MKNNKSNLLRALFELSRTPSRSQRNGRVLRLETLENRELLSASTFQEVATIRELVSSNAIVATAENSDAPIDLSNANIEADWIVDSNLDDGSQGTLRYALERAQAGDTISFSETLKDSTITLTQGELVANKSVTIDASNLYDSESSAPGITINADSNSRIFSLSGSKSNVELVGLKLTGGSANGVGGAIYAASVNLTVSDSVFEGNSATGSGGAIRAAKGSLTLSNVAFNSNTSANAGGAIAASSGTLAIDDSTFTDNRSSNSGAVVYLAAETATVAGSTFNGNATDKFGGAIAATDGSTVIVSDSSFGENTASSGGVFYQTGGSLTVENSVVSENIGRSYGGAIYIIGADSLTINGSTLSKNATSSYGGAVAATKNTSISIKDSTVSENVASIGGGFYQIGGSLSITDSAVSNNSVKKVGGGVYQANAGTLTISGANFNANAAVGNGGAIYVSESVATIQDSQNSTSVFTDNSSQKFGGAIYASNSGSVTLIGGEYLNNAALTGGVVYGVSVEVSVFDSLLSENTATQFGGAFFLNGSQAQTAGATFDSNAASNGGAVYAINGSLTVSDATEFKANSASGLGGAIYENNGILTINGASFNGNVSTTNGGGVYHLKGELNVSNSEFASNTADVGAAVYVSSANANVASTKLVGNTATSKGAGLFATASAVVAQNILVAENAASAGSALFVGNSSDLTLINATIANNTGNSAVRLNSATGVVRNSVVALNEGSQVVLTGSELNAFNTLSSFVNWTDGDNNVEYDAEAPLFAEESFELADGSQAIDLGDNSVVTSELDLAGNGRIQNGTVDLGAYEYRTITVTSLEDDAETEGTLRYAVANAQLGAKIVFAPELDGQTIQLSGSAIEISKSLTIDASALENGIVIDAQQKSRAFTINQSAQVATLAGLTITNGKATGTGGAIYSYGVDLTLDQITVSNSSATTLGGAVYAQTGSVSIANSTFDGDSATLGGALYFHTTESATLRNVTVAGTVTKNCGAVMAMQCELSVYDSVFTNNTSNATSELMSGAAISLFSNYGVIPYRPANAYIENSLFEGNKTTANNGGAISANAGLTLTIVGSDFVNNEAVNGGAISVEGSTLDVTGSRFVGNSATSRGGAIYTSEANLAVKNPATNRNETTRPDATVTLRDTLIAENEAKDGGALYFTGNANVGTTYALVNATIANNTTTNADSGALKSAYGAGTIVNSIFALNEGADVSATGTVEYANTLGADGAIAYDSTKPLFTDVENGDYSLADGSQALNLGDNSVVTTEFDLAGNARIANGVVDLGAYENQTEIVAYVVTSLADDAETEGTLRYLVANAEVGATITFAPELAGQTIQLSGSAIEISKAVTIDATSLENGIVIDAQGNSRAFTVLESAEVATIAGLTIKNGYADGATSADKYGGAVYSYGVNVTLDQITVTNTSAVQLGGAIYSQKGSLTITNSSLTGNTASRGAAIFVHTTDSTTLRGVTVSNNTTGYCGAVMAMQCELSVYDSVFTNNKSDAVAELMSGAAISLFSNYGVYPHLPANAYIENSVFEGNKTTAKNGGAISANAGLTLTIVNSDFINNEAVDGGAISVEGSELIVAGSRFIGNSATNRGGAIYTSSALLTVKDPETGASNRTYPDPKVTLRDTLIVENSANDGGAFYFTGQTGTTFAFVNTTIAKNATTKGASGTLSVGSGSGTISNSIIALNSGADVYGGTVSYANTLGAGGAITYDSAKPLFADVDNGDYALAEGSQAIDRGDDSLVTTEFDLAGNARIVGSAVDLGAYESQATSDAVLDSAFAELLDEGFDELF